MKLEKCRCAARLSHYSHERGEFRYQRGIETFAERTGRTLNHRTFATFFFRPGFDGLDRSPIRTSRLTDTHAGGNDAGYGRYMS